MRSVVLDIKNEQAAVLDDNGVVHAVKDRGYAVGQVLSLTETELKRDEMPRHSAQAYADSSRISRYTRIAAAALAVIIIGGGATAYAAPVSTVTVADGEETVEYKLNLFDRVVGVKAADDAGDELKAEVHELSGQVRGMKITDAMDVTAARIDERRVLVGDDTAIDRPEMSVSISGLRQRNASFNEQLDHKVLEIHERRQGEMPDSPVNTPNAVPYTDDTGDEMTMPGDTAFDLKKDETAGNGMAEPALSVDVTQEQAAPQGDDSGRNGGRMPEYTDNNGNIRDVQPEEPAQELRPDVPANSSDAYTYTQQPDMPDDMVRHELPQSQGQPEMSGDHGAPGIIQGEGAPGSGGGEPAGRPRE